ncbi:hypothetical protein KEM54_001738, partial [Ascosphaera aggregata]
TLTKLHNHSSRLRQGLNVDCRADKGTMPLAPTKAESELRMAASTDKMWDWNAERCVFAIAAAIARHVGDGWVEFSLEAYFRSRVCSPARWEREERSARSEGVRREKSSEGGDDATPVPVPGSAAAAADDDDDNSPLVASIEAAVVVGSELNKGVGWPERARRISWSIFAKSRKKKLDEVKG